MIPKRINCLRLQDSNVHEVFSYTELATSGTIFQNSSPD